MMKFKPNKLITFTVIAVVLIVLIAGITIYFDYNAYKEIGENFLQVFFTNLKVKLIFQAMSFITVFLVSYISVLAIIKNLKKIDSTYDGLDKKSVIVIGALILSWISGSILQITLHEKYLLFANPTLSDLTDPVFNKNIGYYLFTRPFYDGLISGLSGIFGVLFVSVLVIYIFLYARLGIVGVGNVFGEKRIMTHNIINLILFLTVKFISYGVNAQNMLYETNASFTGAGYTSVMIWKVYYQVIPYVLIAASALFVILFLCKKRKLAIVGISLYPLTYIGFLLVSMFTQTFVVNPSEVTMESPYIAYNIKATNDAYGINSIKTEVFPISYDLNREDLEKEHETVSNTRIIDYPSTLKAINQVQSIRNYYQFYDLDIVKYNINGRPTAVGLAPREFNVDNIADSSKSFINERLKFTHGYGLAAVSVNSVTGEGQPEFLVKDIPAESVYEELKISEPRIYFGEGDKDYVIAGSKYKELDYSLGDDDVEYSYTGKAGIKMTPLNQVLYSLYLGDFQLLISGYVDTESKLLINRNVLDRVKKVAPFLTVDNDPYTVIDGEGRIKWIVNCYTTSEYYPYSQPNIFRGNKVNYVRESVKATVDAYDGEVKFYITDETDLIAKSYKKIYPDFFEEGKMPEDISEHLQYPEAMFNLQSSVLKRYHTANPEIFYNKTDMWDFAKEKYQGEEQYVSPYYSITTTFKNEGGLVLMIPYTMYGKQNLVGWLAVNCDKDGYGDMILYTFPKGESIYGTLQFENKIDNDPEISREMTLWGQGGSTVIRGNMLTIPVKNSLLYIEPVYISSGGQNSMPELKRVIVGYKDSIVMEPSLEAALYKLFDYTAVEDNKLPTEDFDEEPAPAPEAKNPEIVKAYDSFKDAMSKGDWNGMGTALEELEIEINKLR
ncbi:MAG: UPF0182 family protein [Ruminococcaceae bacterium]|nr:UPF0182 family protein [Oscillospiraceae bacterium]